MARARNPFADEELQNLERFFPFIPASELAQLFDGRHSTRSVQAKAQRLGIKKSADRLREMGRMNVSVRYPKPPITAVSDQPTQPAA